MELKTHFYAIANPETVFAALHQYKINRDPASFFPSKLVKWRFQVLSENTLGVGATYAWKIWLLGSPVLAFQEQVVAWQAGKSVAYRAIQGWEMDFRVDLVPAEGGTQVDVHTDLCLPGPEFLNRLLLPVYEWGLQKVCRKGLGKENIQTASIQPNHRAFIRKKTES